MDIAKIRNVAFVGHGGVGKTSLVEAILFACGACSRLGRVDDGTTTTDFDPDEIKRKISLNTAVGFADHQGPPPQPHRHPPATATSWPTPARACAWRGPRWW